MIYSITVTNATEKILYMPGDKDYAVTGAVLYSALNDAGYLEFTVPPSNPNYDQLFERKTKVTLYGDDSPIWYGFILESTQNMQKEKKIYCVGELSYLNDTIQPQAKYQHKTPLQLFTAYLAQHNAQSEEQFEVGVVTVTDPNDDVYRFTNQESTLTALREDLCASLEGYLRIRRENGHRYLDLVKLEDYGHDNEQVIEFGYNLLDYSKNTTAADIATACLPRGARLETSPIEGLDAYVDIKSVNDGVDFVQDNTAVAEFGMIKKVVSWDNVTTPTELKAKAIQWLAENQFATMKLTLKAVDMNLLNKDIESFEVGDMVNAKAEPYGMNAWFPVQEKTVNLQDPTQTVIELANSKQLSYTQQQSTISAGLQKEIPQMSSFLDLAKLNAQQIIDLATEGNVYLVKDADGRPVELRIMDAPTEEQATRMWKWNLNGWYSSVRDTTSDQWTTTLAAVLGGGIVADMITSGTISTANFKSSGTKYFYRSNYSASDMTRIQNITMHTVTPTSEDFNKYDLNADGTINTQDYAICRNIIDGNYGTYLAIDYRFEIIQGTTEVSCYIRRYAQNGSYDTGWKQLVSLSAGGIRVTESGNGENTYIGGHSITSNNLTIYGNGYFSGTVTQGSREELKKDIVPAYDMLQKVIESDIYSFRYKFESETDKKHFGLIIGDKYRTADEVISQNQDGIDNYSMTSILWKAVQELAAKVDELSDN